MDQLSSVEEICILSYFHFNFSFIEAKEAFRDSAYICLISMQSDVMLLSISSVISVGTNGVEESRCVTGEGRKRAGV